MDVGCSSSIDTYSIVEGANYSFVELPIDSFEDIKEENFSDLIEKIKSYKKKPLVWSDLSKEIDLVDYDFTYVKNRVKEICQKIDILSGEYIIVNFHSEIYEKDTNKYITILNKITDMASSYGLEIILLINGNNINELISNYKTISDSNIEHPFLKFGVDFSGIKDYNEFFDFIADNDVMGLDLISYFRISTNDASEDNFSKILDNIVEKLADLDTMLCVWNNLDETLSKIKKYNG